MRNIIFNLIFCFVFFSCNDEEYPTLKPTKIDGNYRLQSITSDIEFDFNFDGVKSTNFLEELREEYDRYNYAYYLENRTRSDMNARFIGSVRIPSINVYPESYNLPPKYLIRSASGEYQFNEKNNTITVEIKNKEDYDEATKNPLLRGAELLSDNRIKFYLLNKYYDIKTKKWVWINLESVYKKID